MRLTRILILAVGFISFCGCAKKTTISNTTFSYSRNGKVTALNSNKNLLTVKSEQAAENYGKAVNFSEINALENILYRGISGSIQENPMISDEVIAQQKSRVILEGLIFREGYKVFMTESTTLEDYKSQNAISVVQKVTFDLNALRKFLEKNEVIKKFGF
jgi:hypothetical protein